jgi:hypothetical protein
METNTVQQEILLIKKSTFCFRQLFDWDALVNRGHFSYDEQLEKACRNGWLNRALPEIIHTSGTGEQLYVREITQEKAFLRIELCEQPQITDIQYSINPYVFLAAVCYV